MTRWLLTGLLALVAGVAFWAACRCLQPRVSKRERTARLLLGMPVDHPEQVTTRLPRRHEEWLYRMALTTWPHDEYAAILHEFRHGGGPR